MGTIITNGLRGCWDAGTSLSYPGSGTTWKNIAKTGTIDATFDGATYSAFNGGSVLFDSDKVTVADTTTIDGQYGFSFEIWVYFLGPGDGSSTYNFFSVYNGDGSGLEFGFYLGNNSSVSVGRRGTGGTNARRTTLSDWLPVNNLNKWSCYCATYNGSGTSTATNYALYFNGIEASYDTGTNFGGALNTNTWGSEPGGGAGLLDGYLSRVAFYNRPLTASEVKENYVAQRGRFTI